VSYQPRPLFINGILYIFRCNDITQLSRRPLVNFISDERQAKFTNPQVLNVHGIMKSTERHTADTQIITDWADYKISAVASILQYSTASVFLLHIGLMTLIIITLRTK
jgi:protein gp37